MIRRRLTYANVAATLALVIAVGNAGVQTYATVAHHDTRGPRGPQGKRGPTGSTGAAGARGPAGRTASVDTSQFAGRDVYDLADAICTWAQGRADQDFPGMTDPNADGSTTNAANDYFDWDFLSTAACSVKG